MCESGINIDQLRMSIAQTEEALGLAQEWLEQLHHLADHGKQSAASAELAQVTVMLGEARGKLEKAVNGLGGAPKDDVTVELV
jgi:multidrug resistance efflux pump